MEIIGHKCLLEDNNSFGSLIVNDRTPFYTYSFIGGGIGENT